MAGIHHMPKWIHIPKAPKTIPATELPMCQRSSILKEVEGAAPVKHIAAPARKISGLAAAIIKGIENPHSTIVKSHLPLSL